MVACSVAGMSERPSIRRQLASGLRSETRPTTYESRMPEETQSCGSVLSAPAWGAGQGEGRAAAAVAYQRASPCGQRALGEVLRDGGAHEAGRHAADEPSDDQHVHSRRPAHQRASQQEEGTR
eukprot:scaffold7553_cov57-Phaeocystis_antarctica.AAC.3